MPHGVLNKFDYLKTKRASKNIKGLICMIRDFLPKKIESKSAKGDFFIRFKSMRGDKYFTKTEYNNLQNKQTPKQKQL